MLASNRKKKGAEGGSGRPPVRGRTIAMEPAAPIGPMGICCRKEYSRSRASSQMRFLVAMPIEGKSLSARDTVDNETPASFARSLRVVLLARARIPPTIPKAQLVD